MKYLWIWPFGISLVAVIKSHHFEMWKGQKISNLELCVSTFPTFQTIFWGWCLGRTVGKGMTSPWCDYLKTYFTELIQLKYKLILSINTMGCCVVWLCSLIETLWVLEEKVSLNCWQLPHDVPVTEIFEFNLPVNFLYFLSNWVNLLGIFTTCEKLRAFERNSSLWNSYLMPWRPIVYL